MSKDKKNNDEALKRIYQDAKRQHGGVPLLSGQTNNIIDNGKIKVYSAEEAKAEREKRIAEKPDISVDGNYKPKKANQVAKAMTSHDIQTEALLKFSEPLEKEQSEMIMQAFHYIIGDDLNFPLDKIKRLFSWADVKKHPVTGFIDEKITFNVFYYWGDRGQELLKKKRVPVQLIWQEYDLPQFKKDKENKFVGLINHWKYLIDIETVYEGDKQDDKED